jgi:hypothetical protein
MTRKVRTTVTEEKFRMIIRLANEENNTISQISRIINIDRKAIRNVLKKNNAGEPFVSANEKRTNTTKMKNSIFNEVENLIFTTISCNNNMIQTEIQTTVNTALNLNISRSGISRKLKKMNFTRKRLSLVPIKRNSITKLDVRAIYCTDISRIPIENLVFLDETGFNNHTNRAYGYSPKNIPAFTSITANRGINRSCMAVIDINGVVAYEILLGPYNSLVFISFIRRNLLQYFCSNPNKILIMDNCRFHHSRKVLDFLSEHRIAIKFLPPYSPQLNPLRVSFPC